uniref:Uncharacterized protein n=1 Tax=Brassica oleracea var. oleracea TaxID=109376 RepID=A0A0D3BI59_BRAOL
MVMQPLRDLLNVHFRTQAGEAAADQEDKMVVPPRKEHGYDEGIKDCDKAVERGRKFSSGYKLAAKALTRE